MSKIEIPTAEEMAELAEKKALDFENTVLEGPLMKTVIHLIEEAAIAGRSVVDINLISIEERKSLRVVRKYLVNAGYKCDYTPFRLFSGTPQQLRISW